MDTCWMSNRLLWDKCERSAGLRVAIETTAGETRRECKHVYTAMGKGVYPRDQRRSRASLEYTASSIATHAYWSWWQNLPKIITTTFSLQLFSFLFALLTVCLPPFIGHPTAENLGGIGEESLGRKHWERHANKDTLILSPLCRPPFVAVIANWNWIY